jgi:murein DD-endopeptidase MepM/ murein hydrolase activator NlpD
LPVVAALCALAVPILSETVLSETPPPSILERLHRTEARQVDAERHTRRLTAALDTHGRLLHRRVEVRDVSRRATGRLRRETRSRAALWEATYRQVDQEAAAWAPGTSADMRNLLELSETPAREPHHDELLVLRRALDDDRRVDQSLVRQASLAISLARARADARASRTRRDQILRETESGQARRRAERELGRASARLGDRLDDLRPNPTGVDFHRLKGTLRPPKGGRARPDARRGGLNYRAEIGDEIRATARGVVALADTLPGYGLTVVIDHGVGYHSVYAHLNRTEVEPGAKVGFGDVVGRAGRTGSLDGPVLHFELRDEGRNLDPRDWFLHY